MMTKLELTELRMQAGEWLAAGYDSEITTGSNMLPEVLDALGELLLDGRLEDGADEAITELLILSAPQAPRSRMNMTLWFKRFYELAGYYTFGASDQFVLQLVSRGKLLERLVQAKDYNAPYSESIMDGVRDAMYTVLHELTIEDAYEREVLEQLVKYRYVDIEELEIWAHAVRCWIARNIKQ